MIILGIETSCDETAICLLEHQEPNKYRVIEHIISSQIDLHRKYGGVFPALAKREHAKNIVPMLEALIFSPRLSHPEIAKKISRVKFSVDQTAKDSALEHLRAKEPDLLQHIEASILTTEKISIDRIAVTTGPGLEPALWVGVNFAKALAKLWDIPLVAVNHMEGHVLGSLVINDNPGPDFHTLRSLPEKSVALLISGGHTELVGVSHGEDDNNYSYKILGATRDDALGEAYDKIARMLNLPYPGGPNLSRLAKEYRDIAGNESSPVSIPEFPRPMIHTNDLDFSFAGLKTAVLYYLRTAKNISPYEPKKMRHDTFDVGDDVKKIIAYAFETAVTEVLIAKTKKAIDAAGAEALIVGGGVIANDYIRSELARLAESNNIPILLPTKTVSGDNALMIALAGAFTKDASDYNEILAQGNAKIDK